MENTYGIISRAPVAPKPHCTTTFRFCYPPHICPREPVSPGFLRVCTIRSNGFLAVNISLDTPLFLSEIASIGGPEDHYAQIVCSDCTASNFTVRGYWQTYRVLHSARVRSRNYRHPAGTHASFIAVLIRCSPAISPADVSPSIPCIGNVV